MAANKSLFIVFQSKLPRQRFGYIYMLQSFAIDRSCARAPEAISIFNFLSSRSAIQVRYYNFVSQQQQQQHTDNAPPPIRLAGGR
jgi:hypothetical protein